MRTPWPAVTGGLVVAALGAAGLLRGSVAAPSAAHDHMAGMDSSVVVSGAYVQAPVPPTEVAAGYFTVTNRSSSPDRLTGVQTGAGAKAMLHTVGPDGSMSAAANGTVIPAHGQLVLKTGEAHLMIEKLYGTLKAGQRVNLELDFEDAGPIDLVAPVIAVGAPVPTGGHS